MSRPSGRRRAGKLPPAPGAALAALGGDMRDGAPGWPAAFGLVYLTFFLDNVLLTVLVPIIPDWISGESLALWAADGAPLARVLNGTAAGGTQAAAGLVLSAKALAQLATAAPAAAAVCRVGPARVLRLGTALLLLAAGVFAACGARTGAGAALAAGAGRAAQGAGAACAGVAGLALASAAVPRALADRALGALLGAVALGVLVGYPVGGVAYALWSRAAPFQIIAGALAADYAAQYALLDKEEFNRAGGAEAAGGGAVRALRAGGAAGAGAGAVLLSTSVMAALEPCLPAWLRERFDAPRWALGAAFLPDSAAYLVLACTGGGLARALGAERVALAGQVAVGLAALAAPLARSAGALGAAQAVLGAGLGALDAALVPALLRRAGPRAPHAAALLTAASAAAYALGPAAGGALAAAAGFGTAMRTLAVANLLYAAHLFRALARDPLSERWGARPLDAEPDEPTRE